MVALMILNILKIMLLYEDQIFADQTLETIFSESNLNFEKTCKASPLHNSYKSDFFKKYLL